MAGEAPQARRRDARTPAASCSLQPVRCLDATAHAAQPGERWTLWVKQKGAGAQYAEVEDVDPQLTVSKLKARWASDVALDVHPSFVSLRLVRCAGKEPTAEEEAAAAVLSPRRTLREAGVTDGSSLLAHCDAAHGSSAEESIRQSDVVSLLKNLATGQLEIKESQLKIKEIVSVFSAAALDLWEGCSTTNSERDRFRDELFKHYYDLSAAPKDKATCMVSGFALASMDVTAAHIWPARARSSLALLFGLSLEDLDSYRNGILMAASLEKQFDAQRVAFSYDFIHDMFTFHVLDPKLKNETPKGLIETFGRLEGRKLQHPPGKMPFRRLLVWHYASALKKGTSAGYLKPEALAALPRVPPKEQWMQQRSPGAKLPIDFAWPAVARAMMEETRRASDAEDDD